MFRLKQNEEEARARLRAFWKCESFGDRPALLVNARDKSYERKPWRGPALSRKQQDFDPDWVVWSQLQNLRSNLYLAESIPSTQVSVGGLLTLLAVLAGGDYEYESSAWIQQWKNVLDAPVPKFDPECGAVRKLAECHRKLAEAVGDDGLVTPPVQIDALTTLSMFQNPDETCVSLVNEPDRVKKWTRDATALSLDCLLYFAKLLNGMGQSGSTSWLGTFTEGVMDSVQCDFAVMLSPEMFAEFVMPNLRTWTAGMDDSIYHLDGAEQMRFIEQIATLPNMRGIQWNPAKPCDDISEFMPHFKRIRELGLCLFAWVRNVDDAVRITRELGPDGLLLGLPYFENEEDAHDAIRRLHGF